MSKYTSVELFAGAGGLALGLEMAGFENKALVEIDNHPAMTLKKNRPSWNVLQHNITQIAEDGIKNYMVHKDEIDLLSGGYPCQSFSYAGNGLGIADIRGTLFYDFAKILKELSPKMFFAENVQGLKSHDKGKTLETMVKVFEDEGYEVSYEILNAAQYGVAQKRKRLIIIGVRKDIAKKAGREFRFPRPHLNTVTLRDALKNVPTSECSIYNDKKKAVLDLVPAGGCWKDLPDSVAREYMKSTYFMEGGRTGIARRMSWDEPGLTVLCTPSQKQTERCHPDETRPFSIRESARIQSFPDDWEFSGPKTSQYRQVGNAVPVELAKEVGMAISRHLDLLK